jgi:rfaE bifunctional protein kinase chain/domain
MVPGVLSELAIAHARERRVPVVVDSRYRLKAFAGATAATPNEVEVLDALHLKTDATLTEPGFGARIVKETGIDGFVVTRGSKGMLIFDGEDAAETINVVGSDQATDVTGAGDTVSAVVSLCLAAGATLADAARMATYAASIVVMKRGTATVSSEELKFQLDTY